MSAVAPAVKLMTEEGGQGTRRWSVLAVLFFITAITFADRTTLAIAGPAMAADLGLSALQMGYIFSAFGWAYVLAQLPGGWLLDRFGTRRVYGFSILVWALVTLAQGAVGFFTGTAALLFMFGLRFLSGIANAPVFPACSRIIAAWFPARERATASAVVSSTQYAATVFFAPLMGWVVHAFGWHYVFVVMGALGLLYLPVWLRGMHAPGRHPGVSRAELDYIEAGGAMTSLDAQPGRDAAGPDFRYLGQLLRNRMLLGVYLAQYCLNALTYFFVTWFPVYLVQARGMSILKAGVVASVPAICGFAGGILGGVFSDWLHRRHSLTFARKLPILAGLFLSLSIVLCNYTESQTLMVLFMALSFFGKGIGSLGWAVNSDTAPKEIAGLSGGLLNTFGNVSSITTPIAVGYIVSQTGSFDGALIYVGAHALVAIACYVFVVGEIRRVVLVPA